MDKKQLEERIEKTVFQFLSDSESLSLKTKLAGDLWNWAKLVFGEERVKNAGREIFECVNRSLTNFHGKAKDYIKYISASLKKEIFRANKNNAIFEKQVVSLPEKKNRLLWQIKRYAEENNIDIAKIDVQEKLSVIFGCSGAEISKLILWNERSNVQSENAICETGEEISLFDSKEIFEASLYESPEDFVISKAEKAEIQNKIKSVVSRIGEEFCKKQERVKPYLSALITRQILFELEKSQIEKLFVSDLISDCGFAKFEKATEIVEDYFASGKISTQEEVAAMFGKNKTDASRMMRAFLDKLD